jgi:hypothetical protein
MRPPNAPGRQQAAKDSGRARLKDLPAIVIEAEKKAILVPLIRGGYQKQR